MKKPVDWDELYPGRFIKAGELKGRKVTVTVAAVDVDELEGDDGKKKVKGIVSFHESQKQWALNKTNGICLRAMFGRRVQEWVGKRVILFPDKHDGEDCIRVWGSPDIQEPMKVEIKLPRKRARFRTMQTSAKVSPPPDGEMEKASLKRGAGVVDADPCELLPEEQEELGEEVDHA